MPCRIHFGVLGILIHTSRFHLTICITTILACLEVTCGRQQKKWLKWKGDQLLVRLRISKCKLHWSLALNLYYPLRIKCFPRWRGLRHFSNGAMAMTFSDGSTLEDLSKVFSWAAPYLETTDFCGQISILVLHNVFVEGTTEYLLLKALWCFIEVDIYASLEVHTKDTIMSGREKLTHFYELMNVSHSLSHCIPLISDAPGTGIH